MPPAKKTLTVDEIIAKSDLREDYVDVPSWGGRVKLRAFTKEIQSECIDLASDPVTGEINDADLAVWIVIRGCIEPQFNDDQHAALKKKSAAGIDTIVAAMGRLNGPTAKEAEARFLEGT